MNDNNTAHPVVGFFVALFRAALLTALVVSGVVAIFATGVWWGYNQRSDEIAAQQRQTRQAQQISRQTINAVYTAVTGGE